MVGNGHVPSREITQVGFSTPAGTPAGVEVMSLAELAERARVRMGKSGLMRPQRPDFHHLITLTSGSLWHTVDFTGYALKPGAWLWVRPGQVHQWGELSQAEGTLILFQPGFLDRATAAVARVDDPYAPVAQIPVAEDSDALREAAGHLEAEFRSQRQQSLEVHLSVLRHLLAVLVLRLTHLTSPVGSPAQEPGETYVRFRDAVERDFARTRRLDDYAQALGYSPRTLSRATLAAAGVGAKEYIDRRVVLEAKRLLAHSDQPATRIAARLGFSSATNFGKFFQQRTGQAPIAFRSAARGGTPGPR
ncbi:AraC family transcriptional regulator [Streptomyces sp. NPDC052036]|uniref:helix-turn-helix domain-containing protein n=1 Tax=Streptomyces sp. NPDC052036 TaxID=3155171 RepID=UPI003426A527